VIKRINKIVLVIVIAAIILFVVVLFWPENAGRPDSAGEQPASSRLAELLGEGDLQGFASALEPRLFSFPEDHGPHTAYRNEWWYVTGNLDGPSGERFGFELTIFRFSLAPRAENTSKIDSAWKTDQVYIGHFAVSDVGAEQFHVGQRYSRGSAGLAGATANPFRVWLEDWSIQSAVQVQDRQPESNSSWQLQAKDNDISLDLRLTPLKEPVLNGRQGLSQKSAQAGNASYYYSISRLETDGKLKIGGTTYEVTGLSWLDREWGSSALSKDQQGWDWFALQLSDGSDLMFYDLRRRDGTRDKHSAGTWIDAAGRTTHLAYEDVAIEVREYWESEKGGSYPMEWSISVPKLELQLDVVPVLRNQELITTVRYWEGAVDVRGTARTGVVGGRGYVELTGYAGN
jgi:predicted secreted hydrolase